MKQRILFACILLIHVSRGWGQEFVFTHLRVDNGLSNDFVRCITQDSSGYIWIGTNDGLNRYDGRHFKIYRHDPVNTNSILHNYIRGIAIEKSGLIWIGTQNGLCRLDTRTDSVTRFTFEQNASGLLNPNHKPLPFIDQTDRLWVATNDGLQVFNRQSGKFNAYHLLGADELRENPMVNKIGKIIEDAQHNIWVISFHILFLYDRTQDTFVRFSNAYTEGLTDFQQIQNDEYLCAYWGKGLFVFNRKTQNFRPLPQYAGSKIVLSLARWSNQLTGDLFFIGTNTGIHTWNPESNVIRDYVYDVYNPSGIGKGIAPNFFVDRQNSAWIATTDGVSILNPQAQFFTDPGLRKYEEEYGIVVPYAFHDDGKSYWIASWYGKGLLQFDRNWDLLRHIPSFGTNERSTLLTSAIFQIYAETPDDWWMPSDAGLIHYRPEENQSSIYVPKEKTPLDKRHENLRKVLPKNKDQFWVRTATWGLYVFDKRAWRFIRHYRHEPGNSLSLPGDEVNDILLDANGKLLIATTNGLGEYTENLDAFIRYSHTEGLPDAANTVMLKMINGDDGYVWIASSAGLYRFDTDQKRFKVYTTADGLANNFCSRVGKDEHGRIWISTMSGLSMFDPVSEKFRNFNKGDGLPAIEFDGVIEKTMDHKLIAGFQGGLVVIDPEQLPYNNLPPLVQIGDIRIDDKPSFYQIDATQEKRLFLQPHENIIQVSFSVLNFTNSQLNKYYYMLEGLDRNWLKSPDGNITYTNLSPGSYTLRMKGSNNSGVMNEDGASLSIQVQPYLWETTWFRLLCGLFLALFVYWLVKRRIQNIRYQAEIKQKMAETEMQALRAQMNPHFLFNCLNSIENFIMQNEKRLASDYLNKFAKLIRSMLDSSHNDVVPLVKDMENLQLYIELEQLRFHNKFKSSIYIDAELFNGDYKVPSLLIQPYLENAIMHGIAHSDKSDLKLSLSAELNDNGILYTIKDNGVGRRKAAEYNQKNKPGHRSTGLRITEERIAHYNNQQSANGSVMITDLYDEKHLPAGTKVEVMIKT